MSASPPATPAPPAARATGQAVWDRVWRHSPSDEKDDALLQRERRGPRWALIVDRLEATFGSIRGLRTIELGSGRGDLSVLLAQRGAEVTLFDQSDKALAEAERRFDRLKLPARFERGDMFATPQCNHKTFDVSLSSGVIEHFKGEDRTHAVRAHHDVLRDGGMAIISVPHAWCPSYRLWKAYLELRGWWPYGLEIPYSKRELITRARRAGFAEVDGRCMSLWQSVGDHWCRSLFGKGPDWIGKRSVLDSLLGATLLLFARRGNPGLTRREG
jgi:SAM-dependent methyltransferase